jgi:hypothetical protein
MAVSERPTIVVERGRDPSGLIVAFSGRAPHASAPLFMADLTRRIGWSRILLFDPFDRWYHNGIGHETRTFADVVRLIDFHRRALDPTTLTITGHSSGGYAALVAGQLLRADLVHAFAPFTRLSLRELIRHRDAMLFRRWRAFLWLWLRRFRHRALFDATAVIRAGTEPTRTFVHYCAGYRHDCRRCEPLIGVPGVQLLTYPCGDHSVLMHAGGRFLVEALQARTASAVQEAYAKRWGKGTYQSDPRHQSNEDKADRQLGW